MDRLQTGCAGAQGVNTATTRVGAEELTSIAGDLRFACDAPMPRLGAGARRQPVWWNDTIAELRRTCIAWHRRTQRKPNREDLRLSYRDARKALRNAIKKSKAEFCVSVNEELVFAVKRLTVNIAPGPDCVPNAAIRQIATADPPADVGGLQHLPNGGGFPCPLEDTN